MMIAGAIAIDPPLLFFSPPASGRARGNPGGNPGWSGRIRWILLVQDTVHEVDQRVHEALDEKEHQDHQESKVWACDGELVSSPPFVLGCHKEDLTTRFIFQNTTIVHARGSNAVLKKSNLATGQTSRHLVLNGLSRGAPKQWIHRWPQRC